MGRIGRCELINVLGVMKPSNTQHHCKVRLKNCSEKYACVASWIGWTRHCIDIDVCIGSNRVTFAVIILGTFLMRGAFVNTHKGEKNKYKVQVKPDSVLVISRVPYRLGDSN